MKATFKNIEEKLEKHIKSAEESIFIAVSWFTNENLFELLLDLIHKDVTVELIVNNDHINNRENGLDFNDFIKNGGKFYFADNSRLMHHKFIIIDNKIAISGSYNWTYKAEYHNKENIILIDNSTIVNQFIDEFKSIKSSAELQIYRIIVKQLESIELKEKEYLKEDFYYKSFSEEKKGNMKKSLDAILLAKSLDNSNIEINNRENEVVEKIKNPKYLYHVEDGQFSFDFYENRLIGKEGEIIKHCTGRGDDLDEIYILYIEGFYVECVGNIERYFPETKKEHDELKRLMLEKVIT